MKLRLAALTELRVLQRKLAVKKACLWGRMFLVAPHQLPVAARDRAATDLYRIEMPPALALRDAELAVCCPERCWPEVLQGPLLLRVLRQLVGHWPAR
jgi:hypothetical protein